MGEFVDVTSTGSFGLISGVSALQPWLFMRCSSPTLMTMMTRMAAVAAARDATDFLNRGMGY